MLQEGAVERDGDDKNVGSMEPTANVDSQYSAQGKTDLALEQALCQSEEEAVQYEQCELHEAIPPSTSDIAHARPCDDDTTGLESRLVLLSFTRFPKAILNGFLHAAGMATGAVRRSRSL